MEVDVDVKAAGRGRRAPALMWAAALVAALVVLAGPAAPPAHACSCMSSTDAEAFARSDAVFRGEVVDYRPPPGRDVMSGSDPATWTFAVSAVYKGDVTASQEIVSPASSASCGLEIPGQGEILVFANRDPGLVPVAVNQYVTGLCDGTRPMAAGPLALDAAPYPPRQTGSPAAGGTNDVGDSVGVLAATAALAGIAALVGLAALAVHRRRAAGRRSGAAA